MRDFSAHKEFMHPVVEDIHTPSLRGFRFRETSKPGAPLLDVADFQPTGPDCVRLVAVDPTIAFDVWSAVPNVGVVTSLLMNGATLEKAMRDANDAVYVPGGKRSDGLSRFAAVVVDWDLQARTVRAAQAADCEVWVRKFGEWEPLFTGDMLTEQTRERWSRLAAPQTDRVAHLQSHDEILGVEGAWNSAPLGEFETPVLRWAEQGNVTAVAVLTDGLDRVQGPMTRTADWVRLMHEVPDNHPHHEPHGDLAALVLSTTDTPPAPLLTYK